MDVPLPPVPYREPMSPTPSHRSWKIASVGTFSFLLFTIFVTELAVMEMGFTWFRQQSSLSAALVDAGVLVAVFSLPLFLFCLRLQSEGAKNRRVQPWGIFCLLLAAIFLIEFAVMLLLGIFWPPSSLGWTALIDATLTLLLSAPALWWLFRWVEGRFGRVDLADYLQSPPLLYVLLLFLVFIADLQQELLLPIFFSDHDHIYSKVFGSFLTTLFIAPILWLLVARPLRRVALSAEARTRAVYAQAIDGVITLDRRGLIEYLNPAAQRIFGCSAQEMLGRHASGLFDHGGKVLQQLGQEPAGSAAGSSPLLSTELLARRTDGSLVPMDVSISKLLLQGAVEYLLILRDITERRLASEALRQSETRFRQIFELTDDAIILLQADSLALLDINGVTAKLFGYPPEELHSRGLGCILQGEGYPKVMARLDGIAPGESLQLDDLPGLRQDGSEFVLSLRIKRTRLGDTDILYCTLRDVSDRVRLEAEARELQSKLIQVNKMTSLGLMVSGVAHEINNPNNFILTNAQLLERSWQDARKVLREYCRDNGDILLGGIAFSQLDSHSDQLFGGIVDGSRRIGDIVKNLKGFARQESVDLDRRVDINQVAQAAISILWHEIARFTAKFHFDPGVGLPPVRGNRQQLGQVVVNLLMNACQALPDKQSRVRLQTFFDREAGEVVVMVEDAGSGMSAEAARQALEPFFTTKSEAGGTGLGLSISRSIVKDHQGSLEFSSVPGEGTTFFLKLPALETFNEAKPL